MSIFKAYDIRGRYPSELNEEIAYKIGRALVKFLGVSEVCIGRDMRTSSPSLFENLAEGIMDQGADVIDLGLSSTPMFYFAMGKYGFKSGLIITASHNPAEYNGFKICKQGPIPVFDIALQEIKELVEKNDFGEKKKRGNLIRKEIKEDYASFIWGFVEEIKDLKVVVDAANGMAGLTAPLVFDKLNVELIPMNFELDGRFPNHEADPLEKKNLVELEAKVREVGADLGVSFDGDADRVVFIDENGEAISADLVTALIAKDFLVKNPGATVLYDLRSSKVVEETVKESGGVAIKTRVGHAFIKQNMIKEDAVFAGELSGHYYFKENFYFDSAMIALIKLMNIICKERKGMSGLINPFQKYHHTGEINFRAENKEEIMKKLVEHHSEGKHEDIDGVLVSYSDWWFNVRPSNTEPFLRLNLEADTPELKEEKVEEIKNFIDTHKL